jgi:hypothetical protein
MFRNGHPIAPKGMFLPIFRTPNGTFGTLDEASRVTHLSPDELAVNLRYRRPGYRLATGDYDAETYRAIRATYRELV